VLLRSFFETDDTTITRDFYEAMHSLSTLTGQALAGIPEIASRSRLLDVGGGSGSAAGVAEPVPDRDHSPHVPHGIEDRLALGIAGHPAG
jgi:hypothetical protein